MVLFFQSVFAYSRSCWAYIFDRALSKTMFKTSPAIDEFISVLLTCPKSNDRLVNPVFIPGVAAPWSQGSAEVAIAREYGLFVTVLRVTVLRLFVVGEKVKDCSVDPLGMSHLQPAPEFARLMRMVASKSTVVWSSTRASIQAYRAHSPSADTNTTGMIVCFGFYLN